MSTLSSTHRAFVYLLLLLVSATALFWFLQRRLSEPWITVGVHPEVLDALDGSLDDQRRLAELDPEHEAEYRRRFEERATLLQRLRVLRHARADVLHRYEQILLGIFGFSVALVAAGWLWRHRRQEARLERLRESLADLARGEADVRVGDRGRDVVGRIASMVEETSRVMTRDRRRIKALENLSAWQEAARRHAHEMRTPLTAARLELRRLEDMLSDRSSDSAAAREVSRGVAQELDRLSEFARRFTSFARLPAPRKVRRDLGALLRDIATTFEDAWPNLRLRVEAEGEPVHAEVDAEMLRQVLVNLLDNASHAFSAGGDLDGVPGTVVLRLRGGAGERGSGDRRSADMAVIDVVDDGPGIESGVRARLFEPYTTTRGIGEGMGLGLAICRKILLDHGGELELVETSERGTTFRLSLPRNLESGAVDSKTVSSNRTESEPT